MLISMALFFWIEINGAVGAELFGAFNGLRAEGREDP